MKLNEFILKESFADSIRTSLFRNFGVGGEAGQELAARDIFIKRVVQQFKNSISSAKMAGDNNPNVSDMVTSYLNKYQWQTTTKDKQMLASLSSEAQTNQAALTKLANYLYVIGNNQPKAGRDSQDRTEPTMEPSNSAQATGSSQDKIAPTTQTIIQTINKLTGPNYFDDLQQIAKVAMSALYKQNPTEYTKLYKEITSAGSTPDANPNIQRGYNE
jgi:replication initiation and membrane attachment protein DnaB